MASMLDRSMDNARDTRETSESWLSPVRGLAIGIGLGLVVWVLIGTLIWTLA